MLINADMSLNQLFFDRCLRKLESQTTCYWNSNYTFTCLDICQDYCYYFFYKKRNRTGKLNKFQLKETLFQNLSQTAMKIRIAFIYSRTISSKLENCYEKLSPSLNFYYEIISPQMAGQK